MYCINGQQHLLRLIHMKQGWIAGNNELPADWELRPWLKHRLFRIVEDNNKELRVKWLT